MTDEHEKLLERLAEFWKLEKGWDSYDGLPPNKKVLDSTSVILEAIGPAGVLIYPIGGTGGIHIEWGLGRNEASMHLYNDGTFEIAAEINDIEDRRGIEALESFVKGLQALKNSEEVE